MIYRTAYVDLQQYTRDYPVICELGELYYLNHHMKGKSISQVLCISQTRGLSETQVSNSLFYYLIYFALISTLPFLVLNHQALA